MNIIQRARIYSVFYLQDLKESLRVKNGPNHAPLREMKQLKL